MTYANGYKYRKSHLISGSSDGQQTDYQIRFVVYSGSGTDSGESVYLNSGCSDWPDDIRFTNSSGTNLPFWVEKTDATSSTVWVKVDTIAASPTTTTVYIYFGKASDTSASSGTDTFPFFDHFEGSSLDAKWTVTGSPTISVGSSILDFDQNNNSQYILGNVTFGNNYAVEAYCRDDNNTKASQLHGFGVFSNPASTKYAVRSVYSGAGRTYSFASSDSIAIGGATAGYADVSSYTRFTILRTADYVKGYEGTTLRQNIVTRLPGTDALAISIGAINVSGSRRGLFDWIAVRKFTNVEPAHSTYGAREHTETITTTASVTATLTKVKLGVTTVLAQATATGTATLNRLAKYNRTITRTATATPGISRRLLLNRTITRTATGTPAVGKQSLFKRISTGTATATATITKRLTLKRTITRTATGSPTFARLAKRYRTVSVQATGTPGLSRRLTLNRVITKTATVIASMSRQLSIRKVLATTSQGVATLLAGLPATKITITATAQGAATIVKQAIHKRTITRQATATPSMNRRLSIVKVLGAQAHAVSGIGKALDLHRTITSQAHGTPSLNRQIHIHLAFTATVLGEATVTVFNLANRFIEVIRLYSIITLLKTLIGNQEEVTTLESSITKVIIIQGDV